MSRKIFNALIFVILFYLWGCASTPKFEEPAPVLTLPELLAAGKFNEVKNGLSAKYNVNEVDADGNTALHIAALSNNSEMVLFLIKNGATIDLKNSEGKTPLYVAIDNSAISAAETLVLRGADIFSCDAEGVPCIDKALETNPFWYDVFISQKSGELKNPDGGGNVVHYFVKNKNLEAIESCIRKSLLVSEKDNDGNTPLDLAFSDMGEIVVVEIAVSLIQAGVSSSVNQYDYFQTAIVNRNLNYRFDDGQTPLHIATINGDAAVVQYLLKNDAPSSVQDSAGATPLHEAVRYGQSEIASTLIVAGANVNARDNLGKTPILLVVPQDVREKIYGILIKGGADVSVKDTYGDTVLHTATMTKVPVFVLEALVSAGADVNARNKEGVSPLAISVENRVREHIQFYSENGANIHSRDKNGNTPLLMALFANENLLEYMINSNNILSQDSAGNIPLNMAILYNARLDRVKYIMSFTTDVNIRNADGNTPLYIAVVRNRPRVGEILLAKDADIFATNNKNKTPLSLALNAGGSAMEWMITSKTISAVDGSGNTALHYAAEWGLKDAISALVRKGASTEAKNANGETPIFSAVKNNDPTVIKMLVDLGANVHVRDNLGSSPLHIAVRWGSAKSAKELIACGADINAQNVSGKSSLGEAALSGKFNMATMLLESGANPNTSDSGGRTILMDAIRGQNIELIELLLKYNANPQIQEVNGRNAYHEAALTANKEIIALILRAGGNPLSRDKAGNTPFSLSLKSGDAIMRAVLGKNRNIADTDGNTPIHIVVANNCPVRMLSTLISAGYPCDTRNAAGYTPLGIAIEHDNRECASVLLENGANPFTMIDNRGKCPISIAFDKKDNELIASIAQFAGYKSDIQGNTILHYAAKIASADMVSRLLAYGLDKYAKNISGETPYTTAMRWKRNDVASLLR